MSRLTIMQGLPGSGKSHKALQMAQASLLKGLSVVIASTDNFFIADDGVYRFDGKQIATAHMNNQQIVLRALANKVDHIIVDNTNMCCWEAKPYVQMVCASPWQDLDFALANSPWSDNPEECAKRNAHGVPLDAIKAMQARRQNLTVVGCMEAKAPWER